MQNNNYLPVAAVAKLLNMHTSTISRMAEKGELPAARIASKWLFKEDMLLDFIEKKMIKNVSKSTGQKD